MNEYTVGQEFRGVYNGRERTGIIERVGEGFIVVNTQEGYRTFRLERIGR